MCGVFGWVGNLHSRPTPEEMAEAAGGAAARGPHGHGWVTWDHHRAQVHRALGAVDPTKVPCTAPRIIGHSRLATSGDLFDLEVTHPIERDGHYLVHNGTAEDALPLAFGEPSDTAALAALYGRFRKLGLDPRGALEDVIRAARLDSWALLVLDATGEVVACANDLPLWARRTATGVYLSSRELDGGWQLGRYPRVMTRPEEARVA